MMDNEDHTPRGYDTPRTERQLALERYKREFIRMTRFGGDLTAYLERSQCRVFRYEKDQSDHRRWWLNIVLPENVQEMFDARLEIQVVYTEYENVEPRLLELVQERIAPNPRLDRGLFMIASLDVRLEETLKRRQGDFAAVSLPLKELGPDSPDLRGRMSQVLPALDHYDITRPIQDPSGFFGRKMELQRVVASIGRGQSIGIFGLRKTGKTSLLNHVAAKRRAALAPVVEIDVSKLANADDFRLQLLERSWTAVRDLFDSAAKMPKLRVLDRSGEIKSDLRAMSLFWLRDLEALGRAAGRRLEVFIDEIDQLNSPRSHLGDTADEMRIVLTQLRGLFQSADPAEGMVLICAGTDPQIFERSLLPNGADNLLYKLVSLLFLAPLPRDDMAAMVRDLGRRMGIRVRDAAVIDALFEEYGGHALMTRKACSLASKDRPRDEIPWHMSLAAVEAAMRREGEGTPRDQAADVLRSYGEWFPDEATVLRDLWSDDPEDRELGLLALEENPKALAHAAPYGLTFPDSHEPRIIAVKRAVANHE